MRTLACGWSMMVVALLAGASGCQTGGDNWWQLGRRNSPESTQLAEAPKAGQPQLPSVGQMPSTTSAATAKPPVNAFGGAAVGAAGSYPPPTTGIGNVPASYENPGYPSTAYQATPIGGVAGLGGSSGATAAAYQAPGVASNPGNGSRGTSPAVPQNGPYSSVYGGSPGSPGSAVDPSAGGATAGSGPVNYSNPYVTAPGGSLSGPPSTSGTAPGGNTASGGSGSTSGSAGSMPVYNPGHVGSMPNAMATGSLDANPRMADSRTGSAPTPGSAYGSAGTGLGSDLNSSPVAPGQTPPAGNEYAPRGSSFTPGNTGYNPPNNAYSSAEGAATLDTLNNSRRDPAYRPGGTSNYQPAAVASGAGDGAVSSRRHATGGGVTPVNYQAAPIGTGQPVAGSPPPGGTSPWPTATSTTPPGDRSSATAVGAAPTGSAYR